MKVSDLLKQPKIIKELGDGWRLENGLANGCSRIIRPDGVTALYRYQETTENEALLIKWAYQNGYEHGDSERGHKIKTILGLSSTPAASDILRT